MEDENDSNQENLKLMLRVTDRKDGKPYACA